MKRKVRLTESQFRNIVHRSVNRILKEMAGYNSTMSKSSDAFNQDTIGGKLRSKMFPKKYQQYQRIQGQGNSMGRNAADNINKERENVPMDSFGGFGVYDINKPRWKDYDGGAEGYEARTRNDQARINKYGTGGRVMKPMAGADTPSYREQEDAYMRQQRNK